MKSYKAIGNEDPIATFCRMVNEVKYEDIPPEVVTFAKYVILDTLAAIIGGSGMDGIKPVIDLVKDKGGKPESNIILYGGKVPASEAGMAIGPMSRSLDWAPIHLEAMHNSEYTLPALLAAVGLKEKVTGKEFLTAFIMGQEILIRIGNAFRPTDAVSKGRGHGHYIFGSVAAVGKLLELNQEQLTNAEGISRSMTQPHDMAAFHPVTHMVKVHQGFICQDSINCCLLAEKGITGPHDEVLVGERSYLGFAKWETHPQKLLEGLGKKWESAQLEFKPFPGCKSVTASVIATWDIMEKDNLSIDDIDKIEVALPTLSFEMLQGPIKQKLNPKDEYECQFSLPYILATAVIDKEILPKSYQALARARKNVKVFMPKVSYFTEDGLESWSSKVTVILKEGKKITKMCLPSEIKGSLENQLEEKDFIGKFKNCVPYSVYPLSEDTVDTLIDTIINLEKCDDFVKDVVLPLTPPNT